MKSASLRLMKDKNDKTYSTTEVGTLVESFRDEIHVITERLSPLINDVSELKSDMKEVKSKLTTVEDAVKVAFPAVFKRLDRLENKVFG